MSLRESDKQIIDDVAKKSGLPAVILEAIINKECDGVFFWDVNGVQKPAINIEGHKFYKWLKQLAPAQLPHAVAAGLASPKRGAVRVPKTQEGRYDQFYRMLTYSRDAAYRSISVGAGQIMGENYEQAGLNTPQGVFDSANTVQGQVTSIACFILGNHALAEAVRSMDYATIARLYNGPKYRENNYDVALKNYVKRQADPTSETLPEWVHKLSVLGYEREAGIRAFQSAHDLKVDGIVGPLTQQAIDAEYELYLKKLKKPAQNAGTIAGAAAGTVATGGVIVDAAGGVSGVLDKAQPVIDVVQQVAGISPKLVLVLVGALILGAATYYIVNKLRERHA